MKTILTAFIFLFAGAVKAQALEDISAQLQQLSVMADTTAEFDQLYEQCREDLVAYLQKHTIEKNDHVPYLETTVSGNGLMRIYTMGPKRQMDRSIVQYKTKRGHYVTSNIYAFAAFNRVYKLPSAQNELYLLLGSEDNHLMTTAYAKVLQIKDNLVYPAYPAFEGGPMLMYIDMDESSEHSPAHMDYDEQASEIRIKNIEPGNELNPVTLNKEITIDLKGKTTIALWFDGEKFVVKE